MLKDDKRKRGERHPNASLTPDQVRQIRRRYATEDCSQRDLADDYLVSPTTIYHIVNRITWRHLE